MPSFDVVSEMNIEEVRNATDNATRELSTRFDFRGVEASFAYDNEAVKMSAESEYQVDQLVQIFRSQLAKRKVDPRCINTGTIEITGKNHKKTVTFVQGIETNVSKKLVKLIKDSKMKVQASIQGDKLRVTGKKRDDLQAAMKLIREAEGFDQPFQFNNFRD